MKLQLSCVFLDLFGLYYKKDMVSFGDAQFR